LIFWANSMPVITTRASGSRHHPQCTPHPAAETEPFPGCYSFKPPRPVPIRLNRNEMELTTGILVALCFCCDQRPPSADHISRLREAHERERAYAIRAVSPSRSSLPLSSLQDEAVPIGTLRTPLSEADRMELKGRAAPCDAPGAAHVHPCAISFVMVPPSPKASCIVLSCG